MVKKRQYLILLMITIQLFLIPTLGPYRNIESNNTYNDIPSVADVSVGSYIVPGVLIPPSNLIKIGILGDTKDVTGIHAWNGAFLAAKEINQAGGISIGGSKYYIGLVSEDTDEANYNLDITKAVNAAVKMVNQHDPDFIVGGYRTEALLAYIEVIMDNHVPFISIGANSDILCQQVLDNYARYKYFFRTMPLNSTAFGGEFIAYILTLTAVLGSVYGGTVDKVAIFREDLTWTIPMSAALNYYLPLFGLTVVEEIAFPLTITPVDMAAYWAQIDAAGAQITIPLISAQAGIIMMTQYAALQPGCLVAGIDKLSQLETYWEDTGGACQYEVIPQPVYKTNKTSLTLPFWNSYLSAYDEEPFYTGAGAYDSIKLLIDAVNETQSLNPDIIVGKLEDYDHTTPFQGASGFIAFTPSHDLLEGWPCSYYLFCQWNSYGTKEVLPSWGSVYPDFIATGGLKIPYWGINNLIGPQALPGAFTLSSDASVPDSDGSFNLTWSNSVGATSYSIYYSNQPNLRRLVKIADNAIAPFKISNLMTDEYYFVVVAHNSVGEELSNSLYINVERPRPEAFILTSDAEIPDQDGEFNLTWTDSVGANNYSIYVHNGYITEINQSLTLIADQTGVSPYNLSGIPDGIYYFAVEAHNDTGKTLSNCIEVVVELPSPPSNFTLFSNVETPDNDGNFDLNWTASDGAMNYSVYQYSSYITEINGSLTLLIAETTDLTLPLNSYSNGTYYFIAVAHNINGDTLSNCIEVVVQILPDITGPIISIIAPVMNQQLEIPPAYEITVSDLNLDKIWYTFDNGTTKKFITLLIGVMDQTLWNQLPNGYINIRFYANDTFGNVNYDEVIVIKSTPAQQDGISGYDVVILLGIISVITAYLTKRKFAKKY